ncbi:MULTISPECIES: hypothetical protein [unclassified Exiguobacterium]|uniref:hypothetical protein n=1 Tax=unclassified Exiguobacterium TaxID=2644629 RepID=UPI001BE56DF5|nr:MULTISPECIES: hypothetical protein [unclassified Exiguobacterium]
MKSWTLWFTLLAVTICIMNVSRFDDKNILLFLTSPPFWLLETPWFSSHVIHPTVLPKWTLYALTIAFWFIFGMLLDYLVRSQKAIYKK